MAETRETQVIEDVINGDEISNPRTTEEAILAQVVAGEIVTINPRNRMQYWLSQLESGGSPVTVESITITENGTKTAPEGKAYSPVNVNVPSPNTVETITGTVANPWGDTDTEVLQAAVENGNATAIISCDATAIGYGTFSAILSPFNTNYLEFIAIYGANHSVSGWISISLTYSITNGALNRAYVLAGGASEVTGLTDYAAYVTTVLTIYHHPMPEASNE